VAERDYEAERRETAELWESAAAGWGRQQDAWAEQSAPVAEWLIDALPLRPGVRLLELAAGTGEVGFRAAPLLEPGGTLICSDQSEAMVEIARAGAERLGLRNVEFRVLDGEWIDLPVASVDAVVCRWGYMLMADPAAALRETRRVLRSGGRLSLAVWDARSANPWSAVPHGVLEARGLLAPAAPDAPGPFALADRERLRELLDEAGFADIEIDAVAIVRRAPDFERYWAMQLDLSAATRRALEPLDEAARAEVAAAVEAALAAHRSADGAYAVPGRTLVAVAGA